MAVPYRGRIHGKFTAPLTEGLAKVFGVVKLGKLAFQPRPPKSSLFSFKVALADGS